MIIYTLCVRSELSAVCYNYGAKLKDISGCIHHTVELRPCGKSTTRLVEWHVFLSHSGWRFCGYEETPVVEVSIVLIKALTIVGAFLF